MQPLVLGVIRSRTITNSAIVFVGNALSSALGFLSVLIMSRSLGPQGFGISSTAFAFMYMITGFAELGLGLTVVRFGSLYLHSDPDRLYSVLKVGLLTRFWTSLVVLTLGIALASPVAELVFHDSSLSYALLILVALLGTVCALLSSVAITTLQIYERFHLLAIFSFLPNAVRLIVVSFLFATDRLNPFNATVATAGSAALGLYGLCMLPINIFRLRTTVPLRSTLRELATFGRWIFLSAITFTAITRIDVLLLAHFRGSEEVGIYATGFQLTIILQILTNSLSTVLLPRVSKLESRRQLLRFIKICLALAGMIAVVTLPMLPFAGVIVPTVFGTRYAPAAAIFQVLLLNYLVQPFFMPFIIIIFAAGRPSIMSTINVVQLAIGLFSNYLLMPRYGAIAGAYTLLMLTVIAGVGSTLWGIRLLPPQQEASG